MNNTYIIFLRFNNIGFNIHSGCKAPCCQYVKALRVFYHYDYKIFFYQFDHFGKKKFTSLSKAFYHCDPFVHIDHCDFLPMCPFWIFTKSSRPLFHADRHLRRSESSIFSFIYQYLFLQLVARGNPIPVVWIGSRHPVSLSQPPADRSKRGRRA